MSNSQITILHCSETLVVGGCCRVMEHLATGVDATRFRSMFCAQSGDASYLAYLREKNITPLLLQGGALPEIPTPFIAVLHRPGVSTPFWQGLIKTLQAVGAKAIIERNIFGYPDTYSDRHLHRICANSLNTLWHHWRQSGRPEIAAYLARHRVLYNAVSFAPTPAELQKLRSEWRQKLGIAPQDFVMGIVTRPDPGKIDALMLGLVPFLRKKIPNFTLVTRCYPEALAAPLRWMLGARYHNLPVSADIETLKATYAVMDVFGNFPSIGESFGMAMAEAMRSFLPVIALDLPYPDKGNSQRELIEDGVTGYLAASPVEVVSALQLLASDAPLRNKMGAAAHKKMTTAPFALESVIAQFEAEILRSMGENIAQPVLPDAETMSLYLRTYPKRSKNALPEDSNKALAFQAATFRLGWKLIRKFL